MSDTRQVVTWTELDRATRTSITLSVADAPPYDGFPGIQVRPTLVCLWLTDDSLSRVGFQGDITTGPGSKSGGQIAMNWTTDDPACPEWLLNLAMDAL